MDLSTAFAPLEAARAQDPAAYAIGGAAPRAAFRPATREEAAELIRACCRDRLALAPWGGGVSLALEAAPPRYDVALDVRGLAAIPTYDPDDYTVTAECGITLAALAAALAAHGQELPLEGGHGGRATLGGVLAANASGPRRRRFGAPRDRILGAAFVTGDGTLARSGGRVVKNVAGHAVHRLLTGARGALGVLLEASLKLTPAAPGRAAFVHALAGASLADPARWAPFPRREPSVLSVVGHGLPAAGSPFETGAPFTLVTGFEDDPAWVDACRTFAHDSLGAPAREGAAHEIPTWWRALADLEETPGARLTFTTAHATPAALAPLAGHAAAARLLFHAPAGRLHLWPGAGEAAPLVTLLAGHGFTLIDARLAGVEPAPSLLAVTALRARLSQALDPADTLAFGARWRR